MPHLLFPASAWQAAAVEIPYNVDGELNLNGEWMRVGGGTNLGQDSYFTANDGASFTTVANPPGLTGRAGLYSSSYWQIPEGFVECYCTGGQTLLQIDGGAWQTLPILGSKTTMAGFLQNKLWFVIEWNGNGVAFVPPDDPLSPQYVGGNIAVVIPFPNSVKKFVVKDDGFQVITP